MSEAPSAPAGDTTPAKPAKPEPKVFHVSSAPHLTEGATTQRIMFEVVIALLPLLVVGVIMFGAPAIVLTIATVAGCLATEAVANKIRGKSMTSLCDGSAVVTGVILAYSLPPTIHPYMAFIGGCVAIALAKAVFGGLGHNLFNPAMVGRAFLMICFPAAMVLWAPTNPQIKAVAESKGVAVDALTSEQLDAITTSTPLYQAAKVGEYVKKAAADPEKKVAYLAQAEEIRGEMPTQWQLFLGNVGGCVGETSALLALICGLFLVLRGIADWRQPLAVIGSVAIFATIAHWIAPESVQGPLFYINSGALMFGAFFIATDYVGAPVTPWGRLIFGVGVGVLVMVIRIFGAYPEGFMFSILIMNALTPLIERWTVPTPFGGHVPKPA